MLVLHAGKCHFLLGRTNAVQNPTFAAVSALQDEIKIALVVDMSHRTHMDSRNDQDAVCQIAVAS